MTRFVDPGSTELGDSFSSTLLFYNLDEVIRVGSQGIMLAFLNSLIASTVSALYFSR